VLQHGGEHGVVADRRVVQAQGGERRAAATGEVARAHPQAVQEILERLARRRILQVLDHLQGLAGALQDRQHVARGAAVGVVVERDGHAACPVVRRQEKVAGFRRHGTGLRAGPGPVLVDRV
jgi:hypothetical protein